MSLTLVFHASDAAVAVHAESLGNLDDENLHTHTRTQLCISNAIATIISMPAYPEGHE